jgi:hypothetical protein
VSARAALWFWAIATIGWALLLVPTLLWWKQSLVWIVLMSWWANVAASAAAFYSVWTEMKSQVRHEETKEM